MKVNWDQVKVEVEFGDPVGPGEVKEPPARLRWAFSWDAWLFLAPDGTAVPINRFPVPVGRVKIGTWVRLQGDGYGETCWQCQLLLQSQPAATRRSRYWVKCSWPPTHSPPPQ